MTKIIAIVEDEEKIARILIDYLEAEGYALRWIADGKQASQWLAENTCDLILLDLMLPGKDGMTLCDEIRRLYQTPVFIITAKAEELDRIKGLETGAYDYICKPFSPREVVARVNALFRLLAAQGLNTLTEQPAQRMQLEPHIHRVSYAGTSADLTRAEYRLLENISANPDSVFSRQALVHLIYDDNRVISDRTIDSHIKNLRKKLDNIGLRHNPIRTVHGVGYKWNSFEETLE